MSLIIDSHQHFWDRALPEFDHSWQESPDLNKICRSFLPEDLAPLLKKSGVDKSVFVQTQHNVLENDWALGLAETNEWIAGVVGWVDLQSAECEAQIERYKDHAKFVGVRHVTQDEPDPDFIIRDDVSRGLALLEKHEVPFDLLFYVKHLKHAATVARRFPQLRLVIDHLAKPEIKSNNMEGWISDLKKASTFPNVWCKLSGMVTEADWDDWKSTDLQPYVDAALEYFGPDRCMFGSDWPVCELAASYEKVFEALTDCIGGVSESQRARILGGTAIEFYQLKV